MRLGTLSYYAVDAEEATGSYEFRPNGTFVSQDMNVNGTWDVVEDGKLSFTAASGDNFVMQFNDEKNAIDIHIL